MIILAETELYEDEFYATYPEYLEISEDLESEEPFGADSIDLGGIPTVSGIQKSFKILKENIQKNIQRIRRSVRIWGFKA